MWFQDTINVFFSFALLLNAFLFIPQAVKLYRLKHSSELSLLSFAGFGFIQLVTVIHGYLVKDYILMFGFMLAFITCSTVTILILAYRHKS